MSGAVPGARQPSSWSLRDTHRARPGGGARHVVDLFIDGDALAATRTTLENIRENLSGAAGAMSAVPGDVTGNPTLQSRLSTFGADWNHGIDELAEASGSGAEGLRVIADGFTQMDADLMAALQSEERPGTGLAPEA